MKIRILYFDDCPNHGPTMALIEDVLRELAVEADVKAVHVTPQSDHNDLRFLGSPTVQVDGLDIDPAARARNDFGYSCRHYGRTSVPSRDMVVEAIRTGNGHEHN